jgi:hypothetical protein
VIVSRLTTEGRRTGSHLSARKRKEVAEHEERHARCARAFGAEIVWEYTETRKGFAEFTWVRWSGLTPVQFAAVYYAGSCGSGANTVDEGLGKKWINRLPREERRAGEKEARRLARKYS